VQTTTNHRSFEDSTWLLQLLGPEGLAAVDAGTVSDATLEKIAAFLADAEKAMPLRAAVLRDASPEELDRLVAEAGR
jgi:hypothetical protein